MNTRIFQTLMIVTLLAAAPQGFAQEAQRTAPEGEGQQLPPLGEAAARALNEAIELMNAGNYAEAKTVAEDLDQERLSPYEIGRVEQILATIAFEQEDFATARDHFQKAINSGGLSELEIVNLKFQIAQLFFADELYQEAVIALEEWFGLIQNPNANAYYMLAVAYYQLANEANVAENVRRTNMDKALENVRMAVELTNEPQEAHLSLLIALLMEREDYEEAKDQLNRVLALAPQKKNYWLQLSSVYSQLEDYEEALATVEIPYMAGMLDQPTEIRRYADLLLYNRLGYRCATVLEKGIADGIVEANLSNNQKLADCLQQAGELERAAEVLGRTAPALDTGKDYVRLGEIELRRERFDEAARAFETGIDKGGLDDVDRVELLIGAAFFLSEDPCRAIPWLERARSSAQHRDSANGYLQFLRQDRGCG